MPFKDLNIKREGEFTIENKKEVTIEDKIIKCVSSIKFRVNELSYLKFQYELHHEENQDIINKINNIIKVLNIEFVTSIDDLNATLKGLYKEDKTIYKDKKEYKDVIIQTDNTGNRLKEEGTQIEQKVKNREVQTDKTFENSVVIKKDEVKGFALRQIEQKVFDQFKEMEKKNQEKTKAVVKKPNTEIKPTIKKEEKKIKPKTFDQDVMRYVTKGFRDLQDKRLINFFDKFVKGKNLKQVKADIATYITNKIQNNTEEPEDAEEIYKNVLKYINGINTLKDTCQVVDLCNEFLNLEEKVDLQINEKKKRRENIELERVKQQIADEENLNAFL